MQTTTGTSTSSIRPQLKPAADAVAAMLRATSRKDPSTPTPCADWTLLELAQHAVGTTTGMATIGRREPVGDNPWAGPEVGADDWSTVLADRIDAVAEAWSHDGAWAGSVEMGGEQPASMIGDMAYAEILLHGWDIARAVGADLQMTPEMATALRHTVDETAELGRRMGAYGPEVEVGDDAGDLERALGAAGRDPNWRAPAS